MKFKIATVIFATLGIASFAQQNTQTVFVQNVNSDVLAMMRSFGAGVPPMIKPHIIAFIPFVAGAAAFSVSVTYTPYGNDGVAHAYAICPASPLGDAKATTLCEVPVDAKSGSVSADIVPLKAVNSETMHSSTM